MIPKGGSDVPRAPDPGTGADSCMGLAEHNPIAGMLLQSERDRRESSLAALITSEIVPRLKRIHQNVGASDAPTVFLTNEIDEFGALAIGADSLAASAYFERMREKGHSLESLFVGLFAQTARRLGELWEEDRCDFVDVTLGVARMQELMCAFGGQEERPPADMRQRALLATLPGEKHVFGVDMVAVFMRGASWDVWVRRDVGGANAADLVSNEWFGVVGFTLSAESGLDALARVIETVRRGSVNDAISVIVGGPLFSRSPDLICQVGADGTASDAPTATVLAKKLLLGQVEPSARARPSARPRA